MPEDPNTDAATHSPCATLDGHTTTIAITATQAIDFTAGKLVTGTVIAESDPDEPL